MKPRTQSTQTLRPGRRASALAASVLLLLFVSVAPLEAQQAETNQAGLVIQFGDGQVHTVCIDLGAEGQASSEKVLQASGLATLIDYNAGLGSTVCKIGGVGCNFPASPCFCQCTMKPGDPCVYWTHFHLLDGQWRYSIQAANSFIVRPGDVEGWAWGPGTAQAGTQPPIFSLEQICGAPPATTLPAWTPLSTPPPSATPAPTDTPPPSATPAPTDTPLPSATPAPIVASSTQTATSAPSPTLERPLPTQTSTQAAPTPTPQATAPPALTAPQPSPTAADIHTVGEQQAKPGAESSQGASGKTSGYVFFGVLVLSLVCGLVVLKVRQ